jgi:MHS family proline/betaine transporter-like MFS transporter
LAADDRDLKGEPFVRKMSGEVSIAAPYRRRPNAAAVCVSPVGSYLQSEGRPRDQGKPAAFAGGGTMMSSVAVATSGIQGVKTRKAVTAAVIGNLLEWYDFAVYAFVATIIAKRFFPPGDEVTALLSTFLAFGLGFVARPLGGIIIGRLGDTRGRKFALLLTIMMMAIGTVLIGILPTYETIGVLAPLLLVVARLMQGFSAGGEWGSSTAFIVEWAPKGRRGLYGSTQQMSVVGGLLLGSGVAAILNTIFTPADMETWAWRVPFLLGGILGPVGMYMRRTIEETPAYQKAVETETRQPVEPRTSPWVLGRGIAYDLS